MAQLRNTNHAQALRQSSLAQSFVERAVAVHAFFQPPQVSEFDADFQRIVQSLIWTMLTVTIAMFPLALLNVLLGLSHAVVCLLLTIPPILGLLLLRAGFATIAIHSVLFLCMLGIDGMVLVSGGPTSSSAQWLVVVPMIALALLPPRIGFGWLVVVIANQIMLLSLFGDGTYTSTLTVPGRELAEFAMNFLFAPLVAAMLAYWLTVTRDTMTSRLKGMESDVRLVLDNVPTGFLVVDPKGRLTDTPSRGVVRWLGPAKAGDPLQALLHNIDEARALQFAVAFESLVEEVLPVELLLEQMPQWWEAGGVPHRVAFFLVYDEPGKPWTQLAITVKDARHELHREAAEAERDALAAIVRLLQSERDAFLDFVEESDRLIRLLESDVRHDGWLRALHTMKGNAGVFGLTRLSHVFHEAEQLALAGGRREALRQVREAWSAWRAVFDELVDEGGFDGVRIEDRCYRDFVTDLEAHAPHEELLHSARLWTYQRVRRALERAGSRAASVAERLGKPVPIVIVDSPDLRVDRVRWRPLWAAMIHLIRNAVDHGIESAALRRRRDKHAQGTLTLRSWVTEESIVLSVADDGAGIDWETVRANAASLGLETSGEERIEWLLTEGVSTRETVDEVSGRGVGLASLAEAVHGLDGTLSVTSRALRGTEWRLTVPRSNMHPDDESRATSSAVLRALAA